MLNPLFNEEKAILFDSGDKECYENNEEILLTFIFVVVFRTGSSRKRKFASLLAQMHIWEAKNFSTVPQATLHFFQKEFLLFFFLSYFFTSWQKKFKVSQIQTL